MDETHESDDQTQNQGKYFDVYWQIGLKEAVGTFFLGLLSLTLFKALRQSQARCEALLEQMHIGEKRQ